MKSLRIILLLCLSMSPILSIPNTSSIGESPASHEKVATQKPFDMVNNDGVASSIDKPTIVVSAALLMLLVIKCMQDGASAGVAKVGKHTSTTVFKSATITVSPQAQACMAISILMMGLLLDHFVLPSFDLQDYGTSYITTFMALGLLKASIKKVVKPWQKAEKMKLKAKIKNKKDA